MRHFRKVRVLLAACVIFTTTYIAFLQPGHTKWLVDKSSGTGKIQPVFRTYNFDENDTDSNFERPKFKFLKEPKNLLPIQCDSNLCAEVTNVSWTMVSFIKSKSDHFQHREQMRAMWQKNHLYKKGRFLVVFVVARSNDSKNAALLNEEHERHHDILQMDGPDEYRYVPLKTLAGMQWATEHLPQSYLYSSGDDDFTIYPETLYTAIENALESKLTNKWPSNPIICSYRAVENTSPYRNKTGPYKKWYISADEYKWPFYPKFCLGGFYTTGMDVIAQLNVLSRTQRYLRVDDVWLTGILRQRMGMPNGMVIVLKEPVAVHGQGKTLQQIVEGEKKRKVSKERSKKNIQNSMGAIKIIADGITKWGNPSQ